MLTPVMEIVLALVGAIAGFVGAMTGLGGAAVIMPALSIFMGIPLEYAVGAALVSTIATSSASAASYVKNKIANIRIGMSLEIGTTLGAIVGALLAAFVYSHGLSAIIYILFGASLLFSVAMMAHRWSRKTKRSRDWTTDLFGMDGRYYDAHSKKVVKYNGSRWFMGEAVMAFAGLLSGLLGIGSGVLKVIGMDSGMRLPIKVTTATSDFMIGVTAVTGSGIYWALGYVQPQLVAPLVIGVVAGSYIGTRTMVSQSNRKIAMFFMVMLAIIAIETILRGLGIA